MLESGPGLRQTVVGVATAATDVHETAVAQDPEVARHGGLRQGEQIDDVAHAKFTRPQEVHDPDTYTLAQGPEQQVGTACGDGATRRVSVA